MLMYFLLKKVHLSIEETLVNTLKSGMSYTTTVCFQLLQMYEFNALIHYFANDGKQRLINLPVQAYSTTVVLLLFIILEKESLPLTAVPDEVSHLGLTGCSVSVEGLEGHSTAVNVPYLCVLSFSTSRYVCLTLLQDHYDWGLRAIKSVLVVAGSLKRGDPDRPEDQVLMRALRDFNIPKIVTDDMPVFMGLIGDLFPALDVPRKRDLEFEKFVRQSVLDLKLQAEDNFVLKVSF